MEILNALTLVDGRGVPIGVINKGAIDDALVGGCAEFEVCNANTLVDGAWLGSNSVRNEGTVYVALICGRVKVKFLFTNAFIGAACLGSGGI